MLYYPIGSIETFADREESFMDLGQLEAYLQGAEHRNFSRAPKAVGLTQPAATIRIFLPGRRSPSGMRTRIMTPG